MQSFVRVACFFVIAVSFMTCRAADDLAHADSLRLAIEDLAETFEQQYPHGIQFLEQLDSAKTADGLEAIKREALLASPLLRGRSFVFVVRHQYRNDHHNTATLFQTGEINANKFAGPGAICLLKIGDSPEQCTVETLLEVPNGVARDLDVSFDGQKVLFSMRRNKSDDYHLYEIDASDGEPKQLTFGSGISDIDPIYLPDGRIMFASTREPKYCMCNRHIMCNLFTMEGDGSNIQQIGHSTLFEGHPTLHPDGRILYDRWEYVDRNFGDAQGVWSVNPDGTNHAIFWGNHTNSPGAVLDTRAIPGTKLFVATFSSCHDRPWGALAIVDPVVGLDGREPVVRTWPASAIDLVEKGNYDTFKKVKLKYEDPYPLSEKYFLCVRQIEGKSEQTGIYLIDVFGNELILYSDARLGCYDPLPLSSRPVPNVIPNRTDLTKEVGYFYVTDVYQGLEGIAPGTVKSLRVVESPEKRFWTQRNWQGSGTQAPGMAWNDFNNKRILGTVPVEEDGSVYFSVPADTYLYFQLLDEQGMMVQSMRSGTIVRPGETMGCIGCHEDRRSLVPSGGPTLAMRRAPDELTPWYGEARLFNYLTEVQPVFDRHCVACHDYGKQAGESLNLAGDLGLIFNTSYTSLRRGRKYIDVPGAGPHQVLKPKSWGSHTSPLIKVLLNGHGDPEIDQQIDLDRESFDRIATWIDINAPYYPEYASAYRNHLYGRSPLDDKQLLRLSKLTGVNMTDQKNCAKISFTRPELSECLSQLPGPTDPRYKVALAIILAGKEKLQQRPRAEMAGFELVDDTEIDQQQKYKQREKIETQMRAAIATGQKRYDRADSDD